MFGALKQIWSEARAAPVTDEVNDLLEFFEQSRPLHKYLMQRAFNTFLEDLESTRGPIENWTEIHRKEKAKELFRLAKNSISNQSMAAEMERSGACGVAMLSFYIEMLNLPKSPKALAVIQAIEDWLKKPTGFDPGNQDPNYKSVRTITTS